MSDELNERIESAILEVTGAGQDFAIAEVRRAVLDAIEASGHRVVEATGMAMIDAQNQALLDRAFCMASDVAALVEAQRHEIDAMLAASPKVTG